MVLHTICMGNFASTQQFLLVQRHKDNSNGGACLAMATMQQLEATMNDLKKRKAELRSQSRNAAKRAKRHSSHLAMVLYEAGVQQQCPKLEAKIQAEVLMLLELAKFNTDVVVSFALGQGRLDQYGGSGLDANDHAVRQAMSTAVNCLFLAVDDGLMVDSSFVHGTELEMHSLGRYVVEYKVFKWLLEQNCKKGLSPGGGLVREMASKHIPDQLPLHICHGMKQLFRSGGRAGRYWLVSFQKKWGAKVGCLGIGEDLEPGLLEQKEPWSV